MKFGLLLYPGVEPIDLATVGVVSMARRVIPELEYVTVATGDAPVHLSNGLRVLPDHRTSDSPDLDVLIVPGGPGWMEASKDPAVLGYLRAAADRCVIVSVCTGAMLLARAGLLEGRTATTKVEVIPPEKSPLQTLEAEHPGTEVNHALLVDEGQVITGGGVSLCIDTVLYLLGREFGSTAVAEVARILEYESAHASNRARLDIVSVQ